MIRVAGRLLPKCYNTTPGFSLTPPAMPLSSGRDTAAAARDPLPVPDYPAGLPVVERRADLLAAIARHQVVVVCGETGSGKTTQLPKLCLELGRGTRGRIGHTQPRRIAVRSLAARIAEELRSEPGQRVGYKVRFQDRVGAGSYVKVMTDGILLAETRSDPELREYDTLIIDEAHERSLNIDFLLGYLRRLLPRRPDLKIIITSATIDPQRFSRHFGDAPVIEVSGRTWPVEIRYRPLRGEDEDERARDRGQALLDAVDELAAEGPGDVLVFLPGERDIREAAELLRKHHPPETEILPLYARLSADRQRRIFRPHRGRRIVLATNVAETSLTVPGIRYVVDTGLARISRYSYRTKVQRLPIEPVSQASAAQRSGRCGRLQAGVCIRLYSEDDFGGRPAFTEPEIRRTNLAAVILQMKSLGLGEVEDFPFVDPPDARFVRDGYRLLQELGAVDGHNALTAIGRRLARLPVDPRIGRMVLAAAEHGCLREVLVIAAALEVADPRDRPLDKAAAADARHALFRHPKSDFLAWWSLWTHYHEQARHLSRSKLRAWCREHFLSWVRIQEWRDIHSQLLTLAREMGLRPNDDDADYESIHRALLTGLLGNVALRGDEREYGGARNLKFRLFPGSVLARKPPRWVMAAELVETGQRYLRTAAAIEPAWVEAAAADGLLKRSYAEPHWERRRAQVVAFERVTLYGLPLVERRRVHYGPIDPVVSRELFIRHALVLGEYRSREDFARHNRALLDELAQLEAKARRPDVLADEQDLFDWFDERVPAEVTSGATFERWWKKARLRQPRLLHLPREVVVREAAGAVTDAQYPDHLEVRGLRLPAHYRFAPGEEADGLCVDLPLVALNQVGPADFERLVPGLLEEKLTQLIKSLPKSLRRHFVPAPDFARACLAGVSAGDGPLLEVLAGELRRMTGIDVPADAWRPAQLSRHLHAAWRLLDDDGKVLAESRDLTALQREYGGRARRGFRRSGAGGLERDAVTAWDFGDLPAFVTLDGGGVEVRGYPALVAGETGVALRVLDNRPEALAAHRRGVLRLFALCLGRARRDVQRGLPDIDRQCLCYAPIGSCAELKADILDAVLAQTFVEDGALVREAADFERRLAQGRPRLGEVANRVGAASAAALQAYHDLRRRLQGRLSPAALAAAGEVRRQADALVYAGFVSATPPRWLPQLARYLQAAQRRLDKLAENPGRDRQHAALVAGWRQRLDKALAKAPDDTGLHEFRWLIEELCVSLWAQELGTAVKVSPQRLEKRWNELKT